MDNSISIEKINRVIERGPYQADWESLFQFQPPEWFQKAKFGIFIHWGIYSVPAFRNEWYSRNMYIQGTEEYRHHIKTYGPHEKFGYKDFIPLFRAEKFDPQEWVKLFREAGAKYIFPVAEHHDGFQMYRSALSHYNAYEMGPKRDILGELKCAAEEGGLSFCTSSHRAEHWFFMGHGKEFPSDIHEPLNHGDFYWPAMPEPKPEDLFSQPYPTQEYLEDWLLRTCELIDRYQPKLLYFDWWIQHDAFKPYLKKLAAYYYDRGEEWEIKTAICYKHDAMMFGTGIVDVERGGFAETRPHIWQTDTAIAKNSWCYTNSLEYKDAYDIVCSLVDIVSKNGNLLLNVGPKADGSFAEQDRNILHDIGAWLSLNGEAIYDSKPWRKSSEGPTKTREGQFTDNQSIKYTSEDIRFTVRGGSIYAIVMRYPENEQICVHSLAKSDNQNIPEFHGIIESVKILGYDLEPDWQISQDGLHVQTKGLKSRMPVVIKVNIR